MAPQDDGPGQETQAGSASIAPRLPIRKRTPSRPGMNALRRGSAGEGSSPLTPPQPEIVGSR